VFDELNEKVENLKIGQDAQVYQNEAHEKVENLKTYAFLKKNILQSVCVLT
jgi:hypothetical protein